MKLKSFSLLLCVCTLASTALADVEQSVNDLIPKLAAAQVGERYAAQMELQGLALNAARPGAQGERAALAKVLAARAADATVPQPARVWLVRQLEYVGAYECVPTLTALLKGTDAELKECARRALEKNAAPAATESLRAALQAGGDPSWRIGLIQSLCERRDTGSVAIIDKALVTPETAFAAARALAKIHNQSAVHELWAAFDQKLPVAPDALMDAANRLQAKGESKPAEAIYARLYTACDGVQWRAAALNGLAKAAPEQAKKLIPEALSAADPKLQEAAISTARQVYGAGVSAALVNLLPSLNPSAKRRVLGALDASAETPIIALAADADPAVQVAALETLGRIGGSASVPVLLQMAAGTPSGGQKAAASALGKLSGPGTGAAIATCAAQGETKSRAAAIKALADRNDTAALPVLLKCAGDPDAVISAAGCAALARLGTDAQLEPLAKLTLAGTTPGAEAALQAVASRSRNKTQAADKLIALLNAAEPQRGTLLFPTLVVLGGDPALKAISQSVGTSNEEVKDAAVHALANWPDFAGARPLLIVATDPTAKRVHNVLAIQAVARLVKASDKEPADARLGASLAAMKAATRAEDKKLLLSALASVSSAKAAEAMKPFLAEVQLQPEAALAALSLSEALLKTDKPAAQTLAQAVKDANVSAELTRQAEDVLKK